MRARWDDEYAEVERPQLAAPERRSAELQRATDTTQKLLPSQPSPPARPSDAWPPVFRDKAKEQKRVPLHVRLPTGCLLTIQARSEVLIQAVHPLTAAHARVFNVVARSWAT